MKCAVYIRVSTNKEEQKASLINQRELFLRYIHERGWDLFELYVEIETGTKDRKRPQLKKMLEDAKANKFDIILAKELSRLSRNISLSCKIKDLVMNNELHIITLEGAINTLNGNLGKFGLYAWLSEYESQTTSSRVKYSLDNRARKGLFKGSTPPFGYRIEDGKLYVREDNFPDIVRRIYREYMAGNGQDIIARRLWEDGIPSPSQVAGKSNASSIWHGSTIMLILKNENYTGDLVQSKTTTISVTSEKRKKNAKEDWIIVKDSHEAIISKSDFKTVQELIKARGRIKAVTQTHLFSNILFCSDCGSGMHFKANRKGYVCGNYDKRGSSACASHIVREKELADIILADIRKLISSVKDTKFQNILTQKIEQQKKKIEKELKKITKELDVIIKTKNNALKKFVNDEITKEQYNSIIEEDALQLHELTEKQQQYKTLIAQNFDVSNGIEDITKLQEKISNIQELTPEILNRFVERIEIKEDGSPRIYYRFSGSSIYFSTLTNFETHST